MAAGNEGGRRAAATAPDVGVDRRDKCKRVFDGGASSSAAADRSTTTDNDVVVVTPQGIRVKLTGPIENPWSHGEPYANTGSKCNYCFKGIKGGGVTRLREHLGGLPGNVAACTRVPLNVKALMTDEVAVWRVRRKRNRELWYHIDREVFESNRGLGTLSRARIPLDQEGQMELAMRESRREYEKECANTSPFQGTGGSGSSSCSATQQTTINRYYRSPSVSNVPFDIDLARSRTPVQQRVDVMIRGDHREKLGKALAKWFHANDIAGKKADCPYFRAAIKLAQQLGEGVQIPTGKEIDGQFLDMNYDDMEAHMAEFKDDWAEYGVTIMCDSWTGPSMMCIINFMICCNGRMFFHKSINATGCVQNADFLYDCISEVVVEEIGVKVVTQIVTDNGSNYKKACQMLMNKYKGITWQPCAAHTINLMLKDIGHFPEVVNIVDSAKRICRFFYNHNRLHAMMREKIGGELIRWNATRFGTVFLFLQSFWDKQDKFKAWMTSSEWTNSPWKDEADHKYTYDRLTKRKWWSNIELVLRIVTPIYSVLRYADQQRNATISGFLPKMVKASNEIKANLSQKADLHQRVRDVINTRVRYLLNETLILAAAALDPQALYRTNIAKKQSTRFAVTMALTKLASSDMEAAAAIEQFAHFTGRKGLFGGEAARRSALNGNMSAAAWWDQYGGEYKELQRLARRIVSQCLSSSGCERNWSTFALVHTKVRNRLSYEKLHKLVYVHYNLKLRIQQFENDMQMLQEMHASQDRESDPYSIMMDVAMYDEGNPIMDWLCNSMSESVPTLDEYDDNEPESPIPTRVLIDELGMDEEEVATFRKKLDFGSQGKKKRKRGMEEIEENSAEDSESDSPQGSPSYAESGDSSSDDGEGDGARREQAAPLRPRSTRQKIASVKGLYLQK